MIEIDLIEQPNQELNIVLDDQNCTIQIRQMGDYVYMTLTVDDTAVVDNAIMMPLQKVIQTEQASFSGNFMIMDLQGDETNQENPHYTGFGDRFKLYYLSASEIEEIVNG